MNFSSEAGIALKRNIIVGNINPLKRISCLSHRFATGGTVPKPQLAPPDFCENENLKQNLSHPAKKLSLTNYRFSDRLLNVECFVNFREQIGS